MATVPETELEQRTSEYIRYVRDFATNTDKDCVFHGKRDGFRFSIFNKDVTLEFKV